MDRKTLARRRQTLDAGGAAPEKRAMTDVADSPARLAEAGAGDRRAAGRVVPAARLAIGLLGPAALLSFAMGAFYAAGHPPLDAYTGLGRWSVSGPVAFLGLTLGLWMLAGPSSALVYGAARSLRRGPWAALALATLLPGLGWSVPGIWERTGGPGTPLFLQEMMFWTPAWLMASGACAAWLHLSLTLGRPRERRGDA